MLNRLILATIAFAAGTVLASGAVSTDPREAPAGAYQLEPRHTQIEFSIRHFGITDYHGRFDKASGTLSFNPTDPTKSAVAITIDMTSLNVPSTELISQLAAPAIFDSAKFPTATFRSNSITKTGPNTGTIAGDLTIKGITKPAVLDVTYNGGTPAPMSPQAFMIGFHATTMIKRSDFNMTGVMWSAMVGNDVKLDIDAPFVMAKP